MTENKLQEINEQIKAAEKLVADLAAARDTLINPDEEIEIAEKLHTRKCKRSHEDMCMWFWEVKDGVHNWEGREHLRFRMKARTMLQEETYETIKRFYELADKGW